MLLGDGGEVDSDVEGVAALQMYVHVDDNPDEQRSELQKLLAGDLLDAALETIREQVGGVFGLWQNIKAEAPVLFDQGKASVGARFTSPSGLRRK